MLKLIQVVFGIVFHPVTILNGVLFWVILQTTEVFSGVEERLFFSTLMKAREAE